MKYSSRWGKRAFALLAVPGLLFSTVSTTDAGGPSGSSLSGVGGITRADAITGSKSATSRLAQTDPALLGRDDTTTIAVVVKLDYDSVATYAGGISGLAATSPSATGNDLTGSTDAEQAYTSYIVSREAAFAQDLAAKVPSAKVIGKPLRIVYGGVRVTLPANQIGDLVKVSGVVAVQQDELLHMLTDASASFIGADTVYPQLGGTADAGKGVIFGVLDSGAWPEHPSYADLGNVDAPPAKADGTPRPCEFGDNPLTAATDVFSCNNKLISGEAFLDTYNAIVGGEIYTSARDSNGHGTHTGTTTAGNIVDSAPVLGVERGPLHGIAPGAWVAVYKVCGATGCFSTDSAAAVEQAILDGVDVINFSISGGAQPLTDLVELAFLDAYAAGVFVAASAGNSGPGAATSDHLSPWVTTVAASTQRREFQSALSLTADGGVTAELVGSSITAGITTPLPVVLSSDPPYSNRNCLAPAPAGLFTGKIVACERSPGRVMKGFNVAQGGAAGMILYNPSLADTETDNHWLPTVHLADGTDFVAFMNANTGVTASFTAGVRVDGSGDVMANFSSRGPGGLFVKPDITAPGVQILAGHTPTPESPVEGPPGNYFQAIAGTSMSSPHIAGSAVLMKALHPTWTPGQIKSALMTTATTDVVKEDLVTPADPFDFGAGRVDLTVAGTPGLTFDATATQMFDLTSDPLNAVHLNIPSVNVPELPGLVRTVRVATNVSGRRVKYDVSTTAPDGSRITATPALLDIKAGKTGRINIAIESSAPTGQYFGEITLDPRTPGLPTLHLPVAFVPQQGAVSLTQECSPTSIRRNALTTCTVTATNEGSGTANVDLATSGNQRLRVVGATGATVVGRTAKVSTVLPGAAPGVPAIGPGSLAGYLALDLFGGNLVVPLGDESIVNVNVPAFTYAGDSYSRIGIDSNGYLVVGGGVNGDNNCCNPVLPSPSRPNNILAPFWTDLDGSGVTGALVNVLTDGVDNWLVVEWRVNHFGTADLQKFQVWIGVNGTEDITFAYDPTDLPSNGGSSLVVGAENADGLGASLGANVLPTEDLRVVSSAPTTAGSVTYTVTAKGLGIGKGELKTEMTATTVGGTTVVRTPVTITP